MIRVAQILGKMNGGGVEQVVMNYYTAIDREKVQFDFYIFKGSAKVPVEEIKGMGGRIFVLPTLKRPFRYMKVLQKLLCENGYDIVHCHLSTLSGFALRAAKKAGVRVRILHNHSTSGGRRELVRNLAKTLLKPFAKRYATEYLACSEHAACWMYGAVPVLALTEEAQLKKCARLLLNAVDTEKFRFDDEKRKKLRKELDISQETLVFGHIGRFCPQKNQSFLIDIFREIVKQHEDSVLVMAGTGVDMELIKARVIAEGLTDKVRFLGQRDDADCLYCAFDCFLLPSNYEGLGMVAIEAQCSGLYCVLSDKVPQEAKVTPSAQYLSLKTPPEDWACAAICCSELRNEKGAEQVAQAGYDIKSAAAELERYYLGL